MRNMVADLIWVLSQWWFWLIEVLILVTIWYLFKRRDYKVIDGELFFREGRIGQWVNLKEHLQQEHPEEWDKIKQDLKK